MNSRLKVIVDAYLVSPITGEIVIGNSCKEIRMISESPPLRLLSDRKTLKLNFEEYERNRGYSWDLLAEV